MAAEAPHGSWPAILLVGGAVFVAASLAYWEFQTPPISAPMEQPAASVAAFEADVAAAHKQVVPAVAVQIRPGDRRPALAELPGQEALTREIVEVALMVPMADGRIATLKQAGRRSVDRSSQRDGRGRGCHGDRLRDANHRARRDIRHDGGRSPRPVDLDPDPAVGWACCENPDGLVPRQVAPSGLDLLALQTETSAFRGYP